MIMIWKSRMQPAFCVWLHCCLKGTRSESKWGSSENIFQVFIPFWYLKCTKKDKIKWQWIMISKKPSEGWYFNSTGKKTHFLRPWNLNMAIIYYYLSIFFVERADREIRSYSGLSSKTSPNPQKRNRSSEILKLINAVSHTTFLVVI